MKKIFIGLEGAGKDLHFARLIEQCAYRNTHWRKKYGFTRPIATSMPLSKSFRDHLEEIGIPIIEIKKQSDIVKLNGCDLFIPELSVFFDSRSWESNPPSLREWLSQQSKRGVHFYGACQNWEQIDVAFRRLVDTKNIREVVKFIGSSRPGLNLPPVGNPWGIYFLVKLSVEMDGNFKRNWLTSILSFNLIQKRYCGAFDTNATLSSQLEPYEHRGIKYCENYPECNFKKIIHR